MQREEEEEEEEIKLISGTINRVHDNKYEITPELENLNTDSKNHEAEKEKLCEEEMPKNATELEQLQELVNEMKQKEAKLEDKLLEYYRMKEQESDIVELQRQLKIKIVEIDLLKITVNSLEAEREKLREELEKEDSSRKELEDARSKIKELQRQIQLEANQTRGYLLLLKQQVSGLKVKEEETLMKDAEIEKKLKSVDDLEVEILELKRKNIELHHEKRELAVKLDASESRIAALASMTEVNRLCFLDK